MASSPGGLEKYLKAVLSISRPVFLSQNRPKSTASRTSEYESKVTVIFDGFMEISDSAQALRDIDIYLRRYPFSGTSILRSKYLRFVVESYLHEVYILSERMTSYPEKIRRILARKEPTGRYKVMVRALQEMVESSMKNVTKLRGEHVHQQRLWDVSLSLAERFDFIAAHDNDPEWTVLRDTTYRKARKQWREQVKGNNEALAEVLDMYFDALFPFVFKSDGQSLRT